MTRTRPQPGSGGAAFAGGPGPAPGGASAPGLPERVQACLFDLDGVVTRTAKVHAAAWQEMFDACLRARARQDGGSFAASGPVGDHDAYVAGRGGVRGRPGRVAAGRAGGFGFVVGVDRAGPASELEAHGADVVVSDLAELLEVL